MRPPAFQFYTDDFLAGTFHMSQKDVGAYIRLLCVQWNNGGIPCEPEKISRLAGGKVSEEVIAKFQKCDDGLLRNQRLEKERGKQEQYRALQRDKGVKSAQARAAAAEQRLNRGSNPVGTGGQPAPEVRLEPEGNSPSPSPSPTVVIPPNPPCQGEEPKPWEVAFGLEMPEALRTPECMESVKAWLRYKAEKRSSYKPSGLEVALKKWARDYTPAQFCMAVERSMANGWSGLFEPKDTHGTGPGNRNGAQTPHRNDHIAGDHAEAQRLRDELMRRMEESDVPI